LLPSQSQIAVVSPGYPVYFKYSHSGTQSFSISVTPLNGPYCDLYISTNGTIPPSELNSMWQTSVYGFDSIIVNSSDIDFKANSDYYVSVVSTIGTQYFYIYGANFEELTEIDIVPNVPMSISIPQGVTRIYKLFSSTKTTLVVNAIATSPLNNPDIYITRDPGIVPSDTNCRWCRKQQMDGNDYPLLLETENGNYYIGVRSPYYNSNLQLLVITDTVLLVDGVTQYGFVRESKINYYRFVFPDSATTNFIEFSVHDAPDCDVVLYATQNASAIPSKLSDYERRSTNFELNQQWIIYENVTGSSRVYYLAVSAEFSCVYSIVASTGHSYTFLIEAESHLRSLVPRGSTRYFIYENPISSEQDLSIAVSPTRGNIDLYVSTTFPKPNDTLFSWTSKERKQESLIVKVDDEAKGGSNRFFIGVYGANHMSVQNNYFDILATLSETYTDLEDGSMIATVVPLGQFRYFTFKIPGDYLGDVFINLELDDPLNAVEFYVSRKYQKPNEFQKTYQSVLYGSNFLRINSSPRGLLYIGVLGLAKEDVIAFRLTAKLGAQYIQPNQPTIIQSIRKSFEDRYKTYITPSNEIDFVVISASAAFGKTTLYVDTSGTPATSDSFTHKHDGFPMNIIVVEKTDPLFTSNEWSILVSGEETLHSSNYFLSIQTNAEPVISQLSIPVVGMIPPGIGKNYSMMYEFWISELHNVSQPENYELTIRVLTGKVSVYISQDYPTVNNSTYKYEGRHDKIIPMRVKDLLLSQSLYVRVYGSETEATVFELTLDTTSLIHLLAQDQPLVQILGSPANSYFRVLDPQQNSVALTTYIESCENLPAPRVFANIDGTTPTRNDHFSESKLSAKYYQVINTPEPSASDYVFLGVDPIYSTARMYSLYSTQQDARPAIKNGKLQGSVNNNKLKIIFEPAVSASVHTKTEDIVYDVYLRVVKVTDNQAERLNFETVCAIRNEGTLIGQAVLLNDTTNRYTFEYTINIGKVYVINVIAHNKQGLARSYKQGWIVEHGFATDFTGLVGTRLRDNIGATCIISFIALFVLYLMLGGMINLIRKKKGVHILPNVDFWIDVPFLIIEGVKFVLMCFRVPKRRRRNTAMYGRIGNTTTDDTLL
jgi:hypothetical protein